jgi:hypothetical protein
MTSVLLPSETGLSENMAVVTLSDTPLMVFGVVTLGRRVSDKPTASIFR